MWLAELTECGLLRGSFIAPPHRYHLSPKTAGTIAALLTLREQVIAPILAGVRSPRRGRKPVTWTNVDRDYEKIRIDMQTLFQDLGIRAAG